MFKVIKLFSRIIAIITFLFFIASKTNAAFLSNGFVVTSGLYNYDTKTECDLKDREKSCIGNIKIFYPKIKFSNKEVQESFNNIINKYLLYFATYSFKSLDKDSLNNGNKIVNYQFPDSGYRDYFSVKFLEKEEDVLQRQYSFIFNKNTGDLVDFFEVFDSSNDFRKFISDNFGGFLNSKEDFTIDIKNNIALTNLQFYIETGLFHLVFNKEAKDGNIRILDIVVPKNFIKANYVRS
jgi:hypothetical protein